MPCVVHKAPVMQANSFTVWTTAFTVNVSERSGKCATSSQNSLIRNLSRNTRARGGWKKIKWYRQYPHKIGNFKTIFFIIKPLDQNHDKSGIQMCRVEMMINSFSLLNHDKFCRVSLTVILGKECLLSLDCQRSTHTILCMGHSKYWSKIKVNPRESTFYFVLIKANCALNKLTFARCCLCRLQVQSDLFCRTRWFISVCINARYIVHN